MVLWAKTYEYKEWTLNNVPHFLFSAVILESPVTLLRAARLIRAEQLMLPWANESD